MNKFDFKEALIKIKSTDWERKFKYLNVETFEKINQYYSSILPFLIVPSEIYPSEQFNHNLFRVRPFNKIKDRIDFSEYTYPPKNYVKNQRANIDKQPVLYTSIHPKTATLEYVINQKNKEKVDLLALSVWNVNCDRNIRVVNFLNEKTTSDDIRFLGRNSDKSFKNYVKKEFLNENVSALIELRDFYINSFCEKGKHIFSSFLSHYFLYKANVDVIIYPSIAQNNSSLNIVFNTDFADKYLNLQRVYTIKTIRKKIEKPVFYGDVLFFEKNKYKKEIIIDNSITMTTLTHIDFGDSVK
jgi:hypothetical protein